MATTSIEWTARPGTIGRTWNPTVGCSKTSPGCKFCYALTMHGRLTLMGQKKYAEPFETVRPYPEHLGIPLGWKRPSTIFVNSMSDLFHEDLPNEYIAAVFGVMAACPQHTFQILTKRAERLPGWFQWIADQGRELQWAVGETPASGSPNPGACAVLAGENVVGADGWRAAMKAPWPLPNVWLGVSAENQEYADERIPFLLETPAAIRFVSYEPALGPIDFRRIQMPGRHKVDVLRGGAWDFGGFPGFTNHSDMETIDWVIVGGESGHHARPFDIEWARAVVKECRETETACFIKQLGAKPVTVTGTTGRFRTHDGKRQVELTAELIRLRSRKGSDISEFPEDLRVQQYPEDRQAA